MKPHSPGETPLPTELAKVTEKETLSSGFAELLRIPEDSSLPAETMEILQEATYEIIKHIYSPLQMGNRTLQQENLPTATRELFAKATKEAEETLAFFEDITQGLKGKGKNVAPAVTLGVSQRSENEVILSISPCKKDPNYQTGQHLGRLGLVDIHEVVITVKTAESLKGKEYTPQTIKFIARDQNRRQVRNFRVEVHSTKERKGEQHVQVDAEVDGEILKKTHLDVPSLGNGKKALDRFRLLQYSLLLNVSGKVNKLRNETRGTGKDTFPGLVFADKGHRRRFENAVSLAKNNLGMTAEPEETAVKEVKGEVTLEELQQAASNVPPILISYLREPLAKIWEIPQDGISDSNIVLSYLLEMGPNQVTQKEVTALNGRATKAMETLVNFSILKEVSPEEALEQISKDPILVQAGQKIMDEVSEPEVLISQLGKLATAQDLIKSD